MTNDFKNDFSKEIWKTNYRYKDENSWSDTCKRVAKTVASVEKTKKKREKYEKLFYDIIYNKYFVPGGRILANAGTSERKNATLYNCYVYHPSDYNAYDIDSLENIFASLKQSAKILGREGGLGINLSYLRPEGMYISGIGNRTPGPLKFAEIWDKVSEVITAGTEKLVGERQNGEKLKIRKGAMMLVMEDWNETVLEFIEAKQKSNQFTKFNFSVGVSDELIKAVEQNEKWKFIFPDITFEKYESEWDGNIKKWKEKNYPIVVTGEIKARDLWNKIMISTYNRNEPGVLFLDNANRLSPISYCNHLKSTNPCAEVFTTSVCNLGSINLPRFVSLSDKKSEINFDEIKYFDVIKLAVRFLDNINEIGNPAIPDYNEQIKDFRNIGLGIMGLGSFLMMMDLEYGSEESLRTIKVLMTIKHITEIKESALLGKEKGSFRKFDKKKYFNSYWWKTMPLSEAVKSEIEKIGCMRNGTHSTIAPTGNTAILLDAVSGGIEPVFMKEYNRWVIVNGYEIGSLKRKGYKIPDINKGEWFETEYFKFSKRGNEEILRGTIEDVKYEIDKNRGLTKAIKIEDYGYKFLKENNLLNMYNINSLKTALELDINNHLAVLETCAPFVNMSISKTINIPNNYNFENFKDVYLNAYKKGIKGITTYREGTMTAVLEKIETEKYQNELDEMLATSGVINKSIKLPTEYYSRGYNVKDKDGKKWYINIAFADSNYKKPFALFISTNNRETTEVAEEIIASMEKLCVDKGIDDFLINEQKEKYKHQTNVVKIARAIGMGLRHNIKMVDILQVLDEYDIEFSSLLYHIKRLLAQYVPDGTRAEGKCQVCGGNLIYQEGCSFCGHCGWNKCG